MAWWGHPICLTFRLTRFILLLPYRIVVWWRKPLVTQEQLAAFAAKLHTDDDPAA